MGDHLEFERTLTAPRGWRLPELAAVRALRDAGVSAAVESAPLDLDAVYHDTEDLRLLRHGVTLRRRTGDSEAGWHLKLPEPDGSRLEVRRPLDPDASALDERPPESLVRLVVGLASGLPLMPVARIKTRRDTTELRDGSGAALATVSRDRVESTPLVGGPGPREWREIEVEADDARVELVADVVEALVRAGARREPDSPKLARAMGVPPRYEPQPLPDDPTAGEAVTAYLREQVREFLRRDPEVRRDLPDSVHRARVAARRLRAALAAFRPLLDRDVTDPLRDELRWWGRMLGAARDAEVRRDRLVAAIDELPGRLVEGPVREDLVGGAATEYTEAWRLVVEEASRPRYLAMLRRLDALAADPPLGAVAARPAREELTGLLRAAYRRVATSHRAALDAEGEHRAELLHETRKLAKRARYAAEATVPVLGRRAELLAERLDAVQDALGVHHDAEALAEIVRHAARRAHEVREPTFTYGVIVAGERSRARHALDRERTAWRRVTSRKAHPWAEA